MIKPEATQTLLDERNMLQEQVKKLTDEVTFLKNRIDWFERQIYGQKSERFIPSDSNQTTLPLHIETQEHPVVQEKITYTRTKPTANKTPHGREEIPAHLPRNRIVIAPDFDTTGMEKIGEKITEELHYVPPVLEVNQLVREVFVKVENGEKSAISVAMPPRCIDKGKAGPSLVAHLLTAKGVDHLPLYRISNQFKRESGIDIAESTMNNWFERGCFWMEPIAAEIQKEVFASGYVQMDESTIKVMIQPTKGKSSTGHMWVATSPEQKLVSFTYDKSRSARIARQLIPPDYGGVIQTDDYTSYDWLDHVSAIIHAGCLSHARRKFSEALTNDNELAGQGLAYFKDLFAIDAQAATNGFNAQQRLELRKEKAAVVITQLHAWAQETIVKTTPKSAIGKAIAYLLNIWNRNIRFLENGRIELSNNIVENVIRPLALGRKNWLFAGSENGARRLAILYTILGTCKLNGVDPFQYLCHILEELPKRTANQIHDLLPTVWKPVNDK